MLHRQQRSVSRHLAIGVPSSLSITSCFLFALMGMPQSAIGPPDGAHEAFSATKTASSCACAAWWCGLAPPAARWPFDFMAFTCCVEMAWDAIGLL